MVRTENCRLENCPPPDKLASAILGLLPSADLTPIEEHLLKCETCVAWLDTHPVSDPLVEAMREASQVRKSWEASAAEETPESKDLVEFARQAVARGMLNAPREAANLDTDPTTAHLTPSPAAGAEARGESVAETCDFLAPPQAPDELGRLGPYRVLRLLGEGGMGVVFEAEDVQLKRRVALKAMKPAIAASASARKRFLREAQTAASVEHDHIVAIYQVGDERSIPFIAMPLLRGETLADRLASAERGVRSAEQLADKERDAQVPTAQRVGLPSLTPSSQRLRLPLSEVLRITREIAAGLEAAHERGLIHRDVKPANIWLEEKSGRIKLLDFGLARAADSGEQLTQAGAVMGTPSYMAPEQARGDDVDARADLFSLGCVAYHMATGQRPFAGRDSLATALAVTTRHPTPPRELNPDLSEDVAALIVLLLQKDPASRVQTAAEVVERVRRLEENREQATGNREQGKAGMASGGREPAVCDVHAAAMVEKAQKSDGPGEIASRRAGSEVQNANFELTEGELQATPASGRPALIPAPQPQAPTRSARPSGRGHKGTSAGAAWPPRRTRAIVLATAAFVVLAGVIVIVRDKEGNIIAWFRQPDDGSVEIRNDDGGPAPESAKNIGRAGGGSAHPTDESDQQPIQIRVETTAPLSAMALVTQPAKIPEADRFTIETIGHRGPIYQAEYSRDGELLATLGADGTLRLWSATTGKLVKGLVGAGPEGCFCWSFEGTRLAIGDREGITIWDVATGKRLRSAKIDDALRVWAVAWSPDGRTLATVVSRRELFGLIIDLYDAESGELLDSHRSNEDWIPSHGPVPQCLAWSPDSGKLAHSNGNGILLWNVLFGKPIKSFFKPTVSIAWTNAGVLVAVTHDGTHYELRDAEANELLHTLVPKPLNIHDEMWFRAFSTDGKSMVAVHASDSALTRVSTWNVAAGTTVREIQLQGPRSNDKRFAVASGDDPQVAEFNLITGELRTLVGATSERAWRQAALQPGAADGNTIGSAAWAPDGRTLARNSMGCVWFWNLRDGRPRAVSGPTTGETLASLAWPASDARAYLNTGSYVVFDGVTAAMRRGAQIGPLPGPAVLSSDGSLVAVGDVEQVRIYAADTAKLLHALTTKAKYPPAWSRDGILLATVADETTIWDVATGESLRRLPVAGRCEWSPDGLRLAYTFGNGELLEIRDAKKGELVATLENDSSVVVEGQHPAWSHDGNRIAGFGRVWATNDGKVVNQFQRWSTAPRTFSALWSPDDRYVTYPTPDGSTGIADAATGQVAITLLTFSRNRSLAVSAEGNYRASPRTDEELVYIVETEAGQETLSPRAFAEKYGWTNDPTQVGLGSAERGTRNAEREHANVGVGIEQAEAPIRNPQSEIHNRPVGPLALVQHPARLPKHPDVLSWSIEPRAPIATRQDPLGMLALRPDGKLLAIAGVDGHIRIFDWDSGELARLLIGHASPVLCVDWSRDGKFLGSADRDRGEVRVWEAATGHLVSSALVGMNVACLHWSPDGRALAVGGNDVRLVDPSSGELLPSVTTAEGVGSLSWSPDSKRLAGGGRVAWIWNVVSGELEHTLACANQGQGFPVAWSPDGQTLVSTTAAGGAGAVGIWNAADGTLRKSLDVPALSWPRPVWIDSGTTITGLFLNIRDKAASCKRLNVETGTLIDDPWLEVRQDAVLNVAADRLVTALGNAYGAPVEVYDSVSRKRRTIEFNSGALSGELSPDGTLAVGRSAGNVWICDLSDHGALTPLANGGAVRWVPKSESLLAITINVGSRVFSPQGKIWTERAIDIYPVGWNTISVSADGARAAFVRRGSDTKKVEIWDLNTGEHLRDLEPGLGAIWSLAFSPHGDHVAIGIDTGSPGIGGTWEVSTGKKLYDFTPSMSSAYRLTWSSDGARIAAACADGAVRLCDASGAVVTELPSACPTIVSSDALGLLAWSADGSVFWTADATRTRSWRAADGALLTDRSNSAPLLDGAQWTMSADSRRIVAPAGVVRISDSATGELQLAFVALPHEQAVVIGPDGHYRGTKRVEREIVYVVETSAGQEVLSPKEFATRYEWKNDPDRVTMGGVEK